MPGAFLHKKSLLDQFKDDYKMVNPIKARRTERQWDNPIVRRKREKGVQDWAKSFVGKRHYRKLARFNAMRNEAFNVKEFDKFCDEVLDALYDRYDDSTIETVVNSYPFVEAWDRGLSIEEVLTDIRSRFKVRMREGYKEKTAWAYLEGLEELEGEDSRMEATEKILKAAGYKPGTEGRWYGKDGEEADIIDVLDNTGWAFAEKVCGQLQEARQTKKVCPKFVQINTQRDFDKYIKPALGKGVDAYGLSDIEGMWWEIADGERAPASAKTVREIRDSISKRPSFIFISGVGAERGITDLSLTEYAEEMGMTVKEYLDGYDAGSWESKKSETLEYEKGHKNSRGEDAPWVIRDHKGGRVLASFAKKTDAEAHLERMQRYSKSESLKKALHESRARKLEKMGSPKREASEDAPAILYVREHHYGLGDEDRRIELSGTTIFDKLISLYDAHAFGHIGPAQGSDAWKELDEDEVKDYRDLQEQAKALKTFKDMGKFLVKMYPSKRGAVCAIRQGDDAVWVNPRAKARLQDQEWTGPDAEWLEDACRVWEKLERMGSAFTNSLTKSQGDTMKINIMKHEALDPKFQRRRKIDKLQQASLTMKGFDEYGCSFLDLYDKSKDEFHSFWMPFEADSKEKAFAEAKRCFDGYDAYVEYGADWEPGDKAWMPTLKLKHSIFDLDTDEAIEVLEAISDAIYKMMYRK